MFRLELEYRQFSIYILIILFFFYFTGYIWIFLYLLVWVIAPLEELDPDEVESEEELWPFIENTYIETNWKKGELNIKLELDHFNLNHQAIDKMLLDETNLFLAEEASLNSQVLIINNINALKSIYI